MSDETPKLAYARDIQVRTSGYKPEYAQELLEIMDEGDGWAEACKRWGISRYTFDSWLKKHPSLGEAYELGKARQTAYWEGRLKSVDSSAQMTGTIFKLKNINPDDYLEPERLKAKMHLEVSGNLGRHEQDLATHLAAYNAADLLMAALEARRQKDGVYEVEDASSEDVAPDNGPVPSDEN